MSAIRTRTPDGQLLLIDLGPARTGAEYQRGYKARERDRLNDAAYIETPEGQAWLEDLNRRRDAERRKAKP